MTTHLELLSVVAVLSCKYCLGRVHSHMATYLDLLSVFAVLSCTYRPMTACTLGLTVCTTKKVTHLYLLSFFAVLSCTHYPFTACMLGLAVCIPTWLHLCLSFEVSVLAALRCFYRPMSARTLAWLGCVYSHLAAHLDSLAAFIVPSCIYWPMIACMLGLAMCAPHMATHLAVLSVFAVLSCMYRRMTACTIVLLCAFPNGYI